LHSSLPDDFELGQECELRDPGEEGGVVRCRGVDLLSEEVETHLHAGKQVARLALNWDERLSLLLAEDLCLRRLKFADELMKENEEIPEADQAARLDADFALMADAITSLQERVLALFGGEAE
jgi:recombination associated protein RdgC